MDLTCACPLYEQAIDLLGKRWTGLILRALMERPRRFNEIAAYVEGVSDRLLSERLRELEDAGVVTRVVHPQRPVVIEYVLTEKGASLRKVVEAIQEWANEWIPPKAVAAIAGEPQGEQATTTAAGPPTQERK